MLRRSDLEIVIPSRRRPERCARLMKTMLPTAFACVAEDERDSYQQAGIPAERIRTHANLLGLCRIRNHITQTSEKRACVQIDDDLQCVQIRSGHTQRKIVHPETILEIIYGTSVIADDMGVALFGWGIRPRPLIYKDSDPICLNGAFGGAVGTIGKLAQWDGRILGGGGDPDAFMRELLFRRIIYADRRYYFDIGRVNAGAGGLQDMRSAARCAESKKLMKEKWGDFVEFDESQPGTHTRYKVRRRQDWTI